MSRETPKNNINPAARVAAVNPHDPRDGRPYVKKIPTPGIRTAPAAAIMAGHPALSSQGLMYQRYAKLKIATTTSIILITTRRRAGSRMTQNPTTSCIAAAAAITPKRIGSSGTSAKKYKIPRGHGRDECRCVNVLAERDATPGQQEDDMKSYGKLRGRRSCGRRSHVPALGARPALRARVKFVATLAALQHLKRPSRGGAELTQR